MGIPNCLCAVQVLVIITCICRLTAAIVRRHSQNENVHPLIHPIPSSIAVPPPTAIYMYRVC